MDQSPSLAPPRLLDFGLASLAGFIELPRLTASDVTLGTPAYMSPEQIRDPRNLTPRADLWSVGVMLYEMLTGVLPFRSDNVGTFVIAISSELPVPVRRRAPWLSSGLANVVMQCLEKDPRHRPASARALITALTTLRLTTVPPSAAPAPAPAPAVVETPPPPPTPEPVAPTAPPIASVAPLDAATDAPIAPARKAPSRWRMVTVAVVVLSLLAWAAAYGLPAE